MERGKFLGEGIQAAESESDVAILEDPFFPHEETITHEGRDIKVVFNLVAHIPEFAGQIADAVKDADMVAIELLASKEDKDLLAALANRVTFPHTSFDAITALRMVAEKNSFFTALLEHLQDTKKYIVFIDTEMGEYEFEEQGKVDEIEENLFADMYLEKPQSQLPTLAKAISQWGKAIRLRDNKVAEQVASLADRKDIDISEIAVIQGAVHTATSRSLSLSGVRGRRQFVPELPAEIIPGSKGSKIVFSYYHEAMRRSRFFPERELPPVFLEKVLFSLYLEHALLKSSEQVSFDQIGFLARKIVDGFSDREREEFFLQVSDFTKAVKPEAERFANNFIASAPPWTSEEDRRSLKKVFMGKVMREAVTDKIVRILRERFPRPLPQNEFQWKAFLRYLDNRQHGIKPPRSE